MRLPAFAPGTRVLLVDQWIETGGELLDSTREVMPEAEARHAFAPHHSDYRRARQAGIKTEGRDKNEIAKELNINYLELLT